MHAEPLVAIDPSDEFGRAAQAEADRLKQIDRVRTDAARHLEMADALAAAALELEARARDIEEFLGRATQLSLRVDTNILGGEELRLKAVEVLAEKRGPSLPIHYKEWYDLLRADGYEVRGRDPLATFLSQVTRSPVVASAARNRGVYVLDLDGAATRASRRLRDAEVRLVAAQAAANRRQGSASDRASSDLAQLTATLSVARREHRGAKKEVAEVARTYAVVARVRSVPDVA